VTSPIEALIDASIVCLCCREKGRANCLCAEGVRCEVCRRCATHCRETDRCNAWWWQLAEKLDKATETPAPSPGEPT
jgi:hypothetical protein